MVCYIPAEQRQNCLFSLEEGSVFSSLSVQPLFDVKSHWSMKFLLSTFFLFTVPAVLFSLSKVKSASFRNIHHQFPFQVAEQLMCKQVSSKLICCTSHCMLHGSPPVRESSFKACKWILCQRKLNLSWREHNAGKGKKQQQFSLA